MKNRIVIAGSRSFNNYQILLNIMNTQFPEGFPDIVDREGKPHPSVEIISGAANGVDTLAIQFANRNNLPLSTFPADWKTYGFAAGPIRNKQMAEYAALAEHGILIAIWDGESRGTANMIREAKKLNLDVRIFDFNGERSDTNEPQSE